MRNPLIDDPLSFAEEFHSNGKVGERRCVEWPCGEGVSIWIAKDDGGLVVQLEAEPWADARDVRAAESAFSEWRGRVKHLFINRNLLQVMKEQMRENILWDIERYTSDGRTRWKDLADHYNGFLADLATYEPSTLIEWEFSDEGRGTFGRLLEAAGYTEDEISMWWDSARESQRDGFAPFPPDSPIDWQRLRNRFRPDR